MGISTYKSDKFRSLMNVILDPSQQLKNIGAPPNGTGTTSSQIYNNSNPPPSNPFGAGAISALPPLHNPYYIPDFPRKPIENTGIKVGEITGYRIWNLRDGFLWAFGVNRAWGPNEPMKGEPAENNMEGVWAFKEQSDAVHKICDNIGKELVLGSVKMWGTIIEHKIGYRSEFARVATIDAYTGADVDNDIIQKLRIRYGVRAPQISPGL